MWSRSFIHSIGRQHNGDKWRNNGALNRHSTAEATSEGLSARRILRPSPCLPAPLVSIAFKGKYSTAFHVQLRLTVCPFEPLFPVFRQNNCEFCDILGGQFRIAWWLQFATVHLLALTLRTEVGGKGINWLCLSSRFSSCTRSLSLSQISRLQSNFCASSCNFLLFYCQYGNR